MPATMPCITRAGRRDLQRRDGRDPGRLGQPAAADAAHAGVGRRRLRAEAERVAAMGARGVNMTSDPQDLGAPDLANRGVGSVLGGLRRSRSCRCTSTSVRASPAMTFYGKYPWASHPMNTKLAIGGTLLFIGNARVVTNVILSRDVRPSSRAEDGVGGERGRMDPLHPRDARLRDGGECPRELAQMSKLPSEYFKSNLYATFWFENNRNKLPDLIECGRRGQHPVRDRLPAPDLPLPEPARDGRGQDGDAVAGRAQQDPG